MRRLSSNLLALWIAIMALIALSATSVFAIEPEDLTNVDVQNEYGKKITVEFYAPTQKWQAMAEGNETLYTGLAPNSGGMWYCRSGVVDFTYNGLAQFQDEIWYVENGKVNIDFNGEQEVGDQVYTIIRGKVVDQDYTTEVKRQMALTVLGLVGIIVVLIAARKRSKRKQREHEEQLAKLRAESAERNRQFEEFERQQKIEKAKEVYRDEVENPGLNYKKAIFLTEREKQFYPFLKEVADKYGWSISMKPRLGDLVTGADNQFTRQGKVERSKVQQKHVDFALFDPETQEVKLIIELDDTTHDRQDRVNRDVFVDNVLKGTGYKILHVYDANDLEERIIEELNRVETEE